MRSGGYTLIELLVVISIIAILAVIAFVNYKDFSSDQITIKATGKIQSMLRLAQTNATTGVTCDNVAGASWSAKLKSTTIEMKCSKTTDVQRTYTLDNVTLSIKCSDATDLSPPVTINYAPLNGQVSFTDDSGAGCLTTTNSLVITATNSRNTTSTKSFTISRGGAINVQGSQ